MNSNNPNGFFGNFFPGFQQSTDPFNPFNPMFTNNILGTVNSSLNQAFGGMFPQSGNSQPGNRSGQQQPYNANININNTYSMGNNFYHQPEPQHYHEQTNPDFAQSRDSARQKKKEERHQKKAQENMEKDPQILQAENNPNSGHYYKRLGNECYQAGKFQDALKYYTKALELNDTESVFYSNRARCWKKLGDMKKAYEDAKHAVELDDKNIKAHLLCGQLLAEVSKQEPGLEKINLALNRLTKALTLCSGQNKKEYEKDLNKFILRAKKLRWYKQQQILKQQKIDILNSMKSLIASEDHLSREEREKKYQALVDLMGDPNKPVEFDVPDYLCCKITMELMEDPVVTQSGITYERVVLMEHIGKNGNFDPVTREPINPDYIYPNLAVKQAAEAFLRENPWAFEYYMGETIEDIKF